MFDGRYRRFLKDRDVWIEKLHRLQARLMTRPRHAYTQTSNMNPSSRAAQILEGVETEVVIQRYADRILVLVSQIGKIGNLVRRKSCIQSRLFSFFTRFRRRFLQQLT